MGKSVTFKKTNLKNGSHMDSYNRKRGKSVLGLLVLGALVIGIIAIIELVAGR